MFLLTIAALSFAALLVIVLPGAVLVMALLVNLRRSPEPEAEVRLCLAADVNDPASKPCFAIDGAGHCERHPPLEQGRLSVPLAV
jgi:hypothetical protein